MKSVRFAPGEVKRYKNNCVVKLSGQFFVKDGHGWRNEWPLDACSHFSVLTELQVSGLMAETGSHSGGDEWDLNKPVMPLFFCF